MVDIGWIFLVFCTLGWIPILALCAGISWIIKEMNNKKEDE